jgi:type II secretory pathway pseudopilin PulG
MLFPSLHPLRSARSGMTILEALIALCILGFTTSAVVGLVVTGDRIAGRRTGVSYAVIIAANEAERLKNFQTSPILPNDTTYSDTVNGLAYEVTRTRIRRDPLPADSVIVYQEFSVSVRRTLGPGPSVTLRLLQGYSNDKTQ